MNQSEKIYSLTTDTTITIYWRQKESLYNTAYMILLDGELKGTTEKTHYEFYDLKPDTVYTVQMRWMNGEEPIAFEAINIKTEKKKNPLNIAEAPYYAVGDGKAMNTQIIQKAIDECGEDSLVYIPKGVFLTGALRLHSNMELYLADGAVLQGTDRREDYLPMIPSRFEGIEMMCYSSLLNIGGLNHSSGYHCSNVVIRGEGAIASGGKRLAEKIIAFETDNLKEYLSSLGEGIQECEKPETIPGRLRPRLINISNSQNITISELTLKDGASWNVHMVYSDNIVTHHCTFYSQDVWNGDGWDPDSSTNCTIFSCAFHTGDDGISIKSGKNPEGNEINRPCKNIWIFDCKSTCGHGITIGSEMSGGIEDIFIWDCDMSHSRCGIEIKGTKKRGGYVRNVKVRDCSAARILFHSVSYNDDGIGASTQPVFERCKFVNVHLTGIYLNQDEWIPCQAIELSGFDAPGHELKNISFENVRLGGWKIGQEQNISLRYCENITFKNISTMK